MDEARLRWLFLDLNSYFASVEQQEDPALRGKPVIVVPVASDYTCAIAASIEAKTFGIRTGTKVLEAKALCPGLIIRDARHDLYVRYHGRIVAEIERHLHVTKVMSIDEVACELLGAERRPDNALALARRVQAGVLESVGACMRSSVGLAPSVLLAKTASDMKKPGGLTLLGAHQLPGPLLELGLRDLCGIGRNMEARLIAAGVPDVATLWALSPSRARAVWGSVLGERFWYGLHGIDTPDAKTNRHSIGHSHVLGQPLRNMASAHQVGRKLLARAASRLRRAALRTGGLSVWLRFQDAPSRDAVRIFDLTGDTFRLLRAFEACWTEMASGRTRGAARPLHVGVTLMRLTEEAALAPDLFGWTPAAEEDAKRLRLSAAMDQLNQRYGNDTVSIGATPAGLSRYMGAKIAFNRVPAAADFCG